MALVLTRRPGEAVIFTRVGADGVLRSARLYVISVAGNVVRLALDGPADMKILREELTRVALSVLPLLVL